MILLTGRNKSNGSAYWLSDRPALAGLQPVIPMNIGITGLTPLEVIPSRPVGIGMPSQRDGLLTGLTLLEVILAVSILAICIVAIFQAFISCFDAQLRAENYVCIALLVSDQLEYAEEFEIPTNSGEVSEDIRHFSWQIEQNDIEDYPKLKEVILNSVWEQGRRKGGFSLTTHLWNPQ
ncbi:MAG: hypothetical protein QME51_02305 [Planctomycetota bacterium]|nr:hypothetical protein [Planctomycetota bacterium]MDI6787186.1 hypothetical protein [Planctomycetota bacterium]